MRLKCSSECWVIVSVSNCDGKTVPHVIDIDYIYCFYIYTFFLFVCALLCVFG